MAVELTVPDMGESITEVQIGQWLKSEGDHVKTDEPLCEIESEKATVELPSPVDGVLKEILKQTGEDANIGDVIGYMEEGEAPEKDEKESEKKDGEKPEKKSKEKERGAAEDKEESRDEGEEEEKKERREKREPARATAGKKEKEDEAEESVEPRVMPAARRLMDEKGLSEKDLHGSGPGGRILKEDVLAHGRDRKDAPAEAPEDGRQEEVVRMSPMRRTIAQRLVEAQQQAALLTTFNEVDMTEVVTARKRYQDQFVKKYNVKLGFMSFFVKASIEALKLVPQVNAEIDGENIVYKNYYDIGVAVGGGKGLVVPVLRNAERMSFAEIEIAINDFVERAQKNKISMEELEGGTFTISNGGIYGSLLSTPIINPPQSGILGMHAIQDRPMAVNGEVVIRPMMYVALTYDHRIVDGRGAVTFLKRIKDCIEDPARVLFEI